LARDAAAGELLAHDRSDRTALLVGEVVVWEFRSGIGRHLPPCRQVSIGKPVSASHVKYATQFLTYPHNAAFGKALR
jgi:hypothetical protein